MVSPQSVAELAIHSTRTHASAEPCGNIKTGPPVHWTPVWWPRHLSMQLPLCPRTASNSGPWPPHPTPSSLPRAYRGKNSSACFAFPNKELLTLTSIPRVTDSLQEICLCEYTNWQVPCCVFGKLDPRNPRYSLCKRFMIWETDDLMILFSSQKLSDVIFPTVSTGKAETYLKYSGKRSYVKTDYFSQIFSGDYFLNTLINIMWLSLFLVSKMFEVIKEKE